MSIDEIFSSLSSHMIKGIMLHEQLMNSYLFLGLYGYAKCHEYHYLSETKGSILLKRFVIDHYGILIKQENFSIPDIIPASWLTIHREDVDRSTRYQAMTAALNTWISWEEETRDLYETAYKELLSKNDVPAAEFIKDYILDVEKEIIYASTERIHGHAMDFDIISILEEQSSYEKRFIKKIEGIW